MVKIRDDPIVVPEVIVELPKKRTLESRCAKRLRVFKDGKCHKHCVTPNTHMYKRGACVLKPIVKKLVKK